MTQVVVTFKSADRVIAMYFNQQDDGTLDMQMDTSPEIKEGEDPDLTMLLASAFINAINPKVVEDESPVIYNGEN